VTWRLTRDHPWFKNHVATLEFDGSSAKITFEEAVTGSSGEPGLRKIFGHRLA